MNRNPDEDKQKEKKKKEKQAAEADYTTNFLKEHCDETGCMKMDPFYKLLPKDYMKKRMFDFLDLDVLFQKLKYNPMYNSELEKLETMDNVDSLNIPDTKLIMTFSDDVGADNLLNVYRIVTLLMASKQILSYHSAAEEVAAPAFIFTDVHGQFGDLLRWLAKVGGPEENETYNYVICGDSVDRGGCQLETMLLFLYYKLRYPNRFFFLRGNHEDPNMHRIYGFFSDCEDRLVNPFKGEREHGFCKNIYFMIVHVFDNLPAIAVLDKKIFCVHGGISPVFTACSHCPKQQLLDICTLSEHYAAKDAALNLPNFANERIHLPCEIGATMVLKGHYDKVLTLHPKEFNGALADLMWSDPTKPEASLKPGPNDQAWLHMLKGFEPNKRRGTSFTFGVDAIAKFLNKFGLELIIRGHDVRYGGYEWHYQRKLLTVFTAPRFDTHTNKGGAAIVSKDFASKQLRIDPITLDVPTNR